MFDEYVPDIAEYLDAWQKLAEYTYELDDLKLKLEQLVAQIYLICVQDKKYFINGKPPAISFIKETFAAVGHDYETTQKIASMKSLMNMLHKNIAKAKAIIKSEEMKLNLYQTMSANSRNITGFTDE